MFRLSEPQDLAAIVCIYNQVIERRTVTADLEPVTVPDRQTWFDFHYRNEKYPLWVYEQNNEIVGWCGYSPFYARAAYDGTAEISFYLDQSVQGQGLGKQCVRFLIKQMPSYQLHTLLAFVFGNNAPSIGVLTKTGFNTWGRLPKVADMQDHFEDLVMLGYKR